MFRKTAAILISIVLSLACLGGTMLAAQVTPEVSSAYKYIVRSYSLSTLQKILAVYNQDGTINVADSTAILANKEV